MTSPKSTQKKCPISICLSEVFPVSHSAWQENGADLRTQEVLSSIISPELSSISDLQLFSLKMFPVCYRMVRGKLTSRSSARFRNWGIVLNGLCITAQASEFRNPVSECTLSDILEQNVPEKYFLSNASLLKILNGSSTVRRVQECTPQTAQP